MTSYRGQIPMLPSNCIEDTAQFYTGVLGFEQIGTHYEQGALEWIRLRGGRAQLMFYSPLASGDMPPEISDPAGMVIYLQPENLAALHEAIRTGGHAVSDIGVTFYGMQEFEMTDPNGYTVMFGEPVDVE